MEKLRHLLPIVFIAILSTVSCSKSNTEQALPTVRPDIPSLTTSQARELANLFASLLETNVGPNTETKSSSISLPRTIDNIDVFVEDGDTLMFAINYANNEGFIVIGANSLDFPILSHSSVGEFKFSEISKDSPVNLFLNAYKENILSYDDTYSEFYDNWKDLGKEGYEYEIEICPVNEVIETKAGRKEPSGKKSIYPYTGMELDYWCQKGGYNYYAENKACIGCPAIAVGMLMYDTSIRFTGSHTQTEPKFYTSDSYNNVYKLIAL